MTQKLKSVRSNEPVYIRFLNKTTRDVDVLWLNFDGLPENYYMLAPDMYVDIDTYRNHPWIFEDSKTRDKLVVNSEYVFFPPSWSEILRSRFPNAPSDVQPHRIVMMITLPVYNLRERCLQVVRDSIDSTESLNLTEVNKLQLPKSVEDDLIVMLLRKGRIYV